MKGKKTKLRAIFVQCWIIPGHSNICGFSLHLNEIEAETYSGKSLYRKNHRVPLHIVKKGDLRSVNVKGGLFTRVASANMGLYVDTLPQEVLDQMSVPTA